MTPCLSLGPISWPSPRLTGCQVRAQGAKDDAGGQRYRETRAGLTEQAGVGVTRGTVDHGPGPRLRWAARTPSQMPALGPLPSW